MASPISISSDAEWQSLLSSTTVVIADFYADWCGPCKMIAPHYERLSKQHSLPKKIAFAKVNVDTQSTISRAQGVAAMPTFKIFHNGSCIETIKGANPSALTAAITKAVALAGGGGVGGADAFKNPGRTLGNERAVAGRWADWKSILNVLIAVVGLYLVSLFSFDGRAAAENSMFNLHRQPVKTAVTGTGFGVAGKKVEKSTFKTLADLGNE